MRCVLGAGHDTVRFAALAYDRTYLSKSIRLLQTNRGHILSGGAHRPDGFAQDDQSQIILRSEEGERQFRTSDIVKANEMECFIVWDPCRQHSCTLDVASYPTTYAAAKDPRLEAALPSCRNIHGKWETYVRVGMVLTHLKSVRFLLADGHGAHEWVTRQLLGKPLALPKPLKQLAGAFWSCLEFTDLPPCCIHMAYRVAKCSGESVHVFPGPAHAQKNYAEQLRSCLRTLHFGRKWSDFSSCLETGLFPVAYVGRDSMSDAQAALLLLGRCLVLPLYACICLMSFGAFYTSSSKAVTSVSSCSFQPCAMRQSKPNANGNVLACLLSVGCFCSSLPL